MKLYEVCSTHKYFVPVGPGSLLDEYECPTCVAIEDGIIPGPVPTDPEELFISRITSHENGNCCCMTCEPYDCFDCGHYDRFCTCPVPVSLYKSPKYNHNTDEVPF